MRKGEDIMATATEVVQAARSQIGAFYLFGYAEYTEAPVPDDLQEVGTNCNGIINWARIQCGLIGVGNTGAYYDWITNAEVADPNSVYPRAGSS